jgi:hypothetical protein
MIDKHLSSLGKSQGEQDVRQHLVHIGELLRLEPDLVSVLRRLGTVRAILGTTSRLDVEERAELDLIGRVVETVYGGLGTSNKAESEWLGISTLTSWGTEGASGRGNAPLGRSSRTEGCRTRPGPPPWSTA